MGLFFFLFEQDEGKSVMAMMRSLVCVAPCFGGCSGCWSNRMVFSERSLYNFEWGSRQCLITGCAVDLSCSDVLPLVSVPWVAGLLDCLNL